MTKGKDAENIKDDNSGFTLTEIVVVIAILTLISTLLFSVFHSLRDYRALERDVAEVRAYLEEARIYTQGSREDSSYGVYFSGDEITLFKGDSWATKEKELKKHTFNSSTDLVAGNVSDGDEVVFKGLFGKPGVVGNVNLSGATRDITVSVLSSGFVE
ncbi:MAG: pilus assembly FimT family protein [Patescibacteria group bacterium]